MWVWYNDGLGSGREDDDVCLRERWVNRPEQLLNQCQVYQSDWWVGQGPVKALRVEHDTGEHEARRGTGAALRTGRTTGR